MTAVEAQSVWARLRESPAGKRSKQLARGLLDACMERYLRIETRSPDRVTRGDGHFHDSNGYEPLDYPLLIKSIEGLQLRSDDIVIEIGCGMGRVLCLLARRPVRKCIGIELSEALAAQSERNVRRVRGRCAPVEVVAADAIFADYDEGTAFFLFNSFGPATLQAVLERIRASVEQRPRPIRIMYVNPMHEDLFESAGWLRCTGRIRSRWLRMQASCWSHEPQAAATAAGADADRAEAIA